MTGQPDRRLLTIYLEHLPDGGAWSQAERDRWVAAFTAALDMTIRVEGTYPYPESMRGMNDYARIEQEHRGLSIGTKIIDARAHFFIDGTPYSLPTLHDLGHVGARPKPLAGSELCEMAGAPELWKVQTFSGPDGDFDSLVAIEEHGQYEVVAGDRFTTKGPQ